MGNDGSLPETLKTNIIEALKDIEVEGEPDFIIIPNWMNSNLWILQKDVTVWSRRNQTVTSDNTGKIISIYLNMWIHKIRWE